MPALFKKHNINDYSLGEILKLKRQEKHISLEQAARDTHIEKNYLQALEDGEYNKLPDGLYGKNFLKQYCLLLGLKYRQLILIYEKERVVVNGATDYAHVFRHQRAKKRYFFLLPKLWQSIILMLVIFMGFLYIGYRLKGIIAPPQIQVSFPPPNYITDQNTIAIAGHLEQHALLFINDLPVITKTSGDFTESINLKKGMNIINIKAQKKYGNDTIVVRRVLVE